MKTITKFLTIISTIFFFLNPNNTNGQCHIDDWTALKALYESTNGDNWINRTGWDVMIDNHTEPLVNCDLANLFGVIMHSFGRVRTLGLPNNQLVGNIPTEIGNLTSLEYLYLPSNQLNGSIPPEIGELYNLIHLSFAQNQLSGSLPAELGNLDDLIGLWLSNNQLSGCFHQNLINLCSQLTDYSITIGNSFDLTWNTFCNVGICAEDRCHINDWNALKALYTSLSGSYPCPCGISYPGSYSYIYTYCSDLNNWHNILANDNPPPDCDLGNLSEVSLDIYGRVSSLRLQCVGINNIPPEIGGLDSLKVLEMLACGLSGEIPIEIGNLNKLVNLDLEENQLTGVIPSSIGNSNNLEELDLCDNNLEGHIPPEFGNLINLQRLSIRDNNLEGPIPPEFGNLNNLEDLDLGDNYLVGNIPPELGNLINLENLDLGDNYYLEGPIPPELGNLINLKSLDLGRSNLEGPIPSELGNLINLENLDLGTNYYLEGFIPPELGNLINLEVLDLAWNKLEGHIPPELGNLTNLRRIDLRVNRLSGCYSNSLNVFCKPLFSGYFWSNNFDATWDDFCSSGLGACNCPDYFTIDETTPFQNLYNDVIVLNTDGTVAIEQNQQVEYRAYRITLNEGFSVKQGSQFKVRYGDCD